ncbi:MAG: transcription elongation factor GreA [Rickettsiales bacterium]|jgi:transcription elongation factor GreA|nr:transcription elongation factor GreA [Rickettsiales bacterium]
MEKKPITQKGMERLQEELKNLKEVKRPQIIAQIAEAREHGDLKENAEYHAAREMQGFIESKISEIESLIALSDVINPADFAGDEDIKFGATVQLEDEENVRKKYTIVGETESDVKSGLIAYNSPVASALIGKKVGETVEVRTPSGIKEFEIKSVSY